MHKPKKSPAARYRRLTAFQTIVFHFVQLTLSLSDGRTPFARSLTKNTLLESKIVENDPTPLLSALLATDLFQICGAIIYEVLYFVEVVQFKLGVEPNSVFQKLLDES